MRLRKLSHIFLGALMCVSCSTTRNLPEGSLRLASNDIIVEDDQDFRVTSLAPYLRQTPNSSYFGIMPRLYIYNWSDGSDKGLNRLFKQIGQAPVIFDQNLVVASERSIKAKLKSMGYYNAEVGHELKFTENTASVIYKVKLGDRLTIDEIVYELPSNTDFRQDFLADRPSSLIHRGDYLSEQLIESEIGRSTAALRNKGYYALNRTNYSFVADTISDKGKLVLKIKINEERPMVKANIGKVSISYPEELNIRESVLKGMNLLKPGEPYSEKVVANTYNRFSSLKIFNSVGIDMKQVSDDTVDAEISLSKSKMQGFKTNLEVSTNSTGLMGISPQLNFYHKNIFGGGEWLNFGLTGNFQFRPGDNARSNEFGVSAGISLPRFLGLGYEHFKGETVPRTEFNLAFSFQDRPEYTRSIFSGSFGYNGSISRRFNYQLYPLQIGYVRLFNLNDAFSEKLDRNPFMKYAYQNHCDIGVGTVLSYTSSEDLIPKTSYYSVRFSLDASGNVIQLFNNLLPANEDGERLILGAPFSQYSRVQLTLARGIHFGKDDRQSIAFRLLGGVGFAYGNSTAMPYEKQFYCGGAESMRAWNSRSLGPGRAKMDSTFVIPSQTGDLKLEADMEYRFPIVSKIEGALFLEVGNIFDMKQGIDLSTLAADYGTGVRVNLDFILLRLDLGIRLRDPSADQNWMGPFTALKHNGFALHFGVGYPF